MHTAVVGLFRGGVGSEQALAPVRFSGHLRILCRTEQEILNYSSIEHTELGGVQVHRADQKKHQTGNK